MAMWPFRKRRKTKAAEGKKVSVPLPEPSILRNPSVARKNPRRTSVRRNTKEREPSYAAPPAVRVPDFPLPPNRDQSSVPMAQEFHPRKQPHNSGFSSYFVEQNNSMTDSSASSHRPHKPTSIFRRLSKRGPDRQQEPPPSAYASYSKRDGKRAKNVGTDFERPMSIADPRESFNSSFTSRSSVRGYTVRGVFSPNPRLRCEDRVSPGSTIYRPPHLVPSRSNSRATQNQRYPGGLSLDDHLSGGRRRVDDLADELDARGLREAMERDCRRRERKKQEEQERLQKKLEAKAIKQKGRAGTDSDIDLRDFERDVDRRFRRSATTNRRGYEAGESSGSAAAPPQIGYAEPYPQTDARASQMSTMGTQTPLSWLQDPSSEEINKSGPISTPEHGSDPITSHDSRSKGQAMEESNLPRGSASSILQEDYSQDGLGIAHGSQAQEFTGNDEADARSKTSAWTSFIKRATAARIKKEQASRAIQVGESALISDSEADENGRKEPSRGNASDIQDLRHREGQTPGRHIPEAVSFAMSAMETGHINENRDTFVPTPPSAPYANSVSQSSSKSSLAPPSLSPRPPPRSGSSSRSYATPPTHLTEQVVDSPTIPVLAPRTSSQQSHHYSRPPSIQRYSPSVHRHSSGAASPENRPRSIMAPSLASIDSEGSWLSSKINTRQSVQHISPLRTSASSLRRRYRELDDGGSTDGDEYFSGVEKRPQKRNSDEDVEIGGTRLDLSDVDSDDEEGSVKSEMEKGVWRDGLGKKAVVHDITNTSGHTRMKSKDGMLKDFDDNVRRPSEAVAAEENRPWSPALESSDIMPSERLPQGPTIISLEAFQPRFEHPAARHSVQAEYFE